VKAVVSWFARNSVAANLLMAMIVAAGLLTLGGIKLEIFPQVASDLIAVTILYPGAAPEEVEEGVTVRVEEAIQGVYGIKRITSTSSEGIGSVRVELLPRVEVSRVLDDVKSRVDGIDTFPDDAEEPIIQEVIVRRQVINVAIAGKADETTLKRLGERVRDDLTALPGITHVDLVSVRPYEISIELSEDALRRYGLTFDEVVLAVRRGSVDLPGGAIKTAGGEILIRTRGQAYTGADFAALVLRSGGDGSRLILGDVARVVDGFAETDQASRFDGEPAVMVQVFRVGDQGAIAISDTVKSYVDDARARMPDGITITTWQDYTLYLRGRLDLLLSNGRNGLVLVFLVLALFLHIRVAFWVSVGISVSFLGAISFMPYLGVSINMLSLFAFIVVLGIVVDDAIVVGENIYKHEQLGKSPARAAVEGTQEVAVPVVFAVLTTVAAFAPLTMVAGNLGKLIRVVPLIVIPCLLFSLVESQLVLPSHLSHHRPSRSRTLQAIGDAWSRFQQAFANGLERFALGVYQPALALALRWRYATVASAIAIGLVTAGLVSSGLVGFVFFPDVESDNVAAMLTMPLGASSEMTAAAVQRIERSALDLGRELEAELGVSPFVHVLSSVGEQPYKTTQSQSGGRAAAGIVGTNLGEVHIELTPSEDRTITSTELAQRWRERTGPIPGAVELSFTATIFNPGEPVNVELAGPDLDDLERVAAELKGRLAEFPGVFDITDSFRAGKQEVTLQIRPEAEAVGLTQADLARQVRHGFYGAEAQRVQRGRDDVKVMVRYPEAERRSLGDLDRMRIRLPDGAGVPLSQVADADYGRGFSTIRRADRQRTINVTADVDPARADANAIMAELDRSVLPELLAGRPGVAYRFEGEQREQSDTIGGLKRGGMFALLIIYALLAVPFRSYVQPLVVMIVIPFGLIGAIGGHLLMGMDLTILSMFGIVALSGVVVNDSLVLVDFVNRRRADGMALVEAVRVAGVQRFRPILLTSLTTFAGLTPLLLERSVQAQFLVPMAVSLAFGVLFATLLTLVLVPSIYLIFEDLGALFARAPEAESIETTA